ncbi:unnamed protein product [Auanema sp. JU1783]|nr:unnamed protein product [Auanema sp. JU1783]
MPEGVEYLVEGVQVTKANVEKVLQENFGVHAKILEASPLGKDAIGYMSVIRRLSLQWPTHRDDLPESVIIKITSSSSVKDALDRSGRRSGDPSKAEEEERIMNFLQACMHNNEVTYLRNFTKFREEADFSYPITHYTGDYGSDNSYIVLKDYKDCKLIDLIDGFNEEQLYAIVDQIVKIQAYGFTNSECSLIPIPPERVALISGFVNHLLVSARALHDKYPKVFKKLKTFLDHTFTDGVSDMVSQRINYINRVGRWSLVHGDLWAPQILWDDDRTIGAIVDWQGTTCGSPVEDILRILTTCTSVENRRRLTKPLLDYYHRELTKALAKKDFEIPFTREDIEQELVDFYPCSLMSCVFANSFWDKAELLSGEGRMDESFSRLAAFIDDVLQSKGL